jgi:hypothetical protein
MSQSMPAGMPQQAMVSAPAGQPQQPALSPDSAILAPVPQAAPVAAASAESTDPYLRARAAANVWQTNRNLAAQ